MAIAVIQGFNPEIIIGNPPYQDEAVGQQKTFNEPIYNLFLDEAYKSAGLVEMIHPARFLSNAGGTPKPWNNQMLADRHLSIAHYEETSKTLFPETEIKGGLAVSLWDKQTEHNPIGVFTPHAEMDAVMRSVCKRNDFVSFSSIVVSRTAYRFTELMHEEHPEAKSQLSEGHLYDVSTNIFERLPQIFYATKPADGHDYIRIMGRIGNERCSKFVRRDYIRPVDNLEYYKVLMSKANGTGTFGESLTSPFVADPAVGNTETFVSIGKFHTSEEANAVVKYIKTKFVRALLGTLKTTQDISPEKWQNVPLQDFTAKSDIDWSRSVEEINAKLYEKYALSAEERGFIDKNVRPM